MNNSPLISIITPIYNGERYILETIQSVLSQTYENWEMIIVDNKSTDNSLETIKTICDERIRIISLEYNSGGPARPRNIGLDNAKGEYVAFLDADDVWLSEKLEMQVDFLKENNINFTSCYCSLINASSDVVFLSKKSSIYYKFVSKENICDVIKNSFIITSSVLIKKDLVLRFSEEKSYIAVEDFDMWLRVLVLNSAKYKYQDKKLVKYRVLENSASDRNNVLGQELKANIVLSHFVLEHQQFLLCYFHRIFLFFLVKKMKIYFKKNDE